MITFANLFNPNLKTIIKVSKQLDEKMDDFCNMVYEKIQEDIVQEKFSLESVKNAIQTSMEIFEDIEEKKKRLEKEEAVKRKEREKIEREEKKRQKELEKEEKKKQKEIEREEKKRQKEEAMKKKQEEKRLKQMEKELKKNKMFLSKEQMLEIIKKENETHTDAQNPVIQDDVQNDEESDEEEEHIINKFDFSNDEKISDEYWSDMNVEIKNIKIKNGIQKQIKIHRESNVVFEVATNETIKEYDLDERYINQKIFVGVLHKKTSKIIKEIKLCDTIKNWVYTRGLVVPSYELCRLDFEDELNNEF